MSESKHAEHATHVKDAKHGDQPIKGKDLEPLASDKDHDKPKPAQSRTVQEDQGKKPAKGEKPQSLFQRLKAIRDRVEAAANSPRLEGKAEEFSDCWDELDEIGAPGDQSNPADIAMVQAAHNHLQHHAPRRASEMDALEQQLEELQKGEEKPQAKPDTPQMALVKERIASLQTDLARDPRALPSDVERARGLQQRVDTLNMEKAQAK